MKGWAVLLNYYMATREEGSRNWRGKIRYASFLSIRSSIKSFIAASQH